MRACVACKTCQDACVRVTCVHILAWQRSPANLAEQHGKRTEMSHGLQLGEAPCCRSILPRRCPGRALRAFGASCPCCWRESGKIWTRPCGQEVCVAMQGRQRSAMTTLAMTMERAETKGAGMPSQLAT